MPRSPNLVWHSTAKYEEMLRPKGLVGSNPILGVLFIKKLKEIKRI